MTGAFVVLSSYLIRIVLLARPLNSNDDLLLPPTRSNHHRPNTHGFSLTDIAREVKALRNSTFPAMASGAVPLPGTAQALPADTPEEIRDYQRIIGLRNEIYMGKHPRFKPPSIVRPAPQPAAAVAPSESSNKPTTASGNKPTTPAATPAAVVAAPQNTPANTTTTSTAAAGHIEDILLAKSDVLVKAETTLKRQRIENEVRNQLEHKKNEARLGMEVKDGKAVADAENDVDLEAALETAGIRLKPVERPEDPSSANKLKGFFGDKGERDDRGDRDRGDGGDMARKSDDALARRHGTVEDRFDNQRATGTAGVQATKEAPADPPHSRVVETLREREKRPPALPLPLQPQPQPQPSQDSSRPGYPANNLLRTPLASPRPRYSATSQVRSPAAPQPVRPANVARVESQNRIIELENAGRLSPLPPAHNVQVPAKRAKQSSPDRIIKRESGDISPFPREDYPRRVMSPENVGALQPLSRESVPPPGRPSYRVPPDVATQAYHQNPPLYGQPAHRYPVEAYPYQDPYAHPPPAGDYRRPYVSPYAAPPSASPYYAPRPVYEDYGRYGSKPPSVRPPFSRRSASPSDLYARRRSSRSRSPDRGGRRDFMMDIPGQMDQRMPPEGSPGPKRARLMPYGAGPDLRTADAAGIDYAYPPPPRRERVYYEGRAASYPPQVPLHPARYAEEPPFVVARPESAMYRREEDYRGYREREYPGPSQARSPMSLAEPYTPVPEYARPPTRAAMGVPPDGLEYPPRAGADYYGRLDGRASVRPGEGSYLPPPSRQASVRPDAVEYYGERAYRAASVRPDLERDRYVIPPPSMAPAADYSPYDGPGGYRYRD